MRIELELGDCNRSSEFATPATPAASPGSQTAIDFRAVNGWRGPGAIAIAVGHLGVGIDSFPTAQLLPITLIVDLFFLFSGLVIAHGYAARLATASNIPEYVIRRVGRIWPVQAATLALMVAYEVLKLVVAASGLGHFTSPPFSAAGNNLVEAIPTNLLLMQSLGLHDRETWNFPSWSLSVEFATYIVFAGFCRASPKLRRQLSVVAIFACLMALAFVAPKRMHSTYDFGVLRCLSGFLTGTLCYEVARSSMMACWRFPTLIEVAAVLGLGLWLRIAFENWAIFTTPFVFSVFVLAFMGRRRGLLSKLLATRTMSVLSELSFSIYMVHALVLIGLLSAMHVLVRTSHLDLFRMIPNPNPPFAGATALVEVIHLESAGKVCALVLAYMAVVLLAAVATYRFVEVPGRKMFARLAKRIGDSLNTSRPQGASGIASPPMERAR